LIPCREAFLRSQLSLLIAWQTFQLANQLGLERAELTIPLLFLQPAFFLVCTQTLTEPLLALLFVIALRLHLTGPYPRGNAVVSLHVLVRPEGFFLAALWCGWVRLDLRRCVLDPVAGKWRFCPGGWPHFVASGDPLWIAHNWPPDWQTANQVSGHGADLVVFHPATADRGPVDDSTVRCRVYLFCQAQAVSDRYQRIRNTLYPAFRPVRAWMVRGGRIIRATSSACLLRSRSKLSPGWNRIARSKEIGTGQHRIGPLSARCAFSMLMATSLRVTHGQWMRRSPGSVVTRAGFAADL
jgi:hypothetical protein